MRLKVSLPTLKPNEYKMPEVCPLEGCEGTKFYRHGSKVRAIEDLRVREVKSYRYKCTHCGRTFWVHPVGVNRALQSDRAKAMSVFLYLLGVSYGGVADFFTALDVKLKKSSAYYNVQAAGMASREKQRQSRTQGGKRQVIGADGTYLKVKGQLVGVEVVVDPSNDSLLALELVASESAEEIEGFIQAIAREVGADVLVSDDLEVYKGIADENELAHQICQGHVIRNVDKLAESIQDQIPPAGHFRKTGIRSMLPQVEKDLKTLQWLVRDRPPDATQFLAKLLERYRAVPTPLRGKKHPPEYRLKMALQRLWDRWDRITLNRHYPALDGTNNAAERVIGWWIKERYRTMRGYKRRESVRNVVTLTALIGAASTPFPLQDLYRQ